MTDLSLLSVAPKETHSLTTRDGIRLDADVYTPQGDGPFPVLLMRQPYGRAIASTVVYAHPSWYAAHGYIVVIQDVRGRGTSEGKFDLFAHEVEDGKDTVDWAAQLPHSNGKVGMYGFSYQGMTQLYAAQAKPANLKVIAPAMVGYDLYQDWAYENGALRLQAGLGWAIQLAAETARLKGDNVAFHQLRIASRNLPVNAPVSASPEVMQQYAPHSFWHDWLTHPTYDEYWQSLKPDLATVDLPMLHVGGWFDPYLTGDLRLYQEFEARSQYPQHLWVGPWSHIPWSRKVGEVDFGAAAINPIDQLQIRWFDYFLKDKDNGVLAESSVNLFEMGSNQWRRFDQWPTQKNITYRLKSNGLASLREDDGVLIDGDGDTLTDATFEHQPSSPQDIIVHDPWRPVPSIGGHTSFPAGSFERSHIDGRSDVLTYTTALLEKDLEVIGQGMVSLKIETDAPGYDLCAVLSVVHPDHRIFNLTQGYKRIFDHPSQKQTIIPLQPSCFKLFAGQALRLSLSASYFPAYTVNPGFKPHSHLGHEQETDSLDTISTLEHQIITLTLHQQDIDTLLTLPVR